TYAEATGLAFTHALGRISLCSDDVGLKLVWLHDPR
ncbi:MAG: hypothetical protein RLZ49_307, partial [Actinomycetota bacterium]